MISAALVVRSDSMSPNELTALLQCEPDETRVKGEPSTLRGRANIDNVWRKFLPDDAPALFGTQGLSAAIEGLGRDLAARLSQLRQHGASVCVSVLQEVRGDDDHLSMGIQISPAAAAWLAAADAVIDFDQYFYESSTTA